MQRVLFQDRTYSVTAATIEVMRAEWQRYRASLEQGYRGECVTAQDACPIACTINMTMMNARVLPGHYQMTYTTGQADEIRWDTPSELREKLDTWDRTGTLDPFSFTISMPSVDY